MKTTMNRRYGNAPLGEPAHEVQRYASNANFTINLLHSMQGIDYVNVIDGASNGFELLLFFEEALNVTRADGSVILERGDSYHGQLWIPSRTLHRTSVKRNVGGMRSTYFVPASLFATFQYLRVLLSANQSFLELPSRTSRKSNRIFYFFSVRTNHTAEFSLPRIFK